MTGNSSEAAAKGPADVVIGIDLGTTNSLAAIMGKDGPRILYQADGSALIPSVVSFLDDGQHVRAASRFGATPGYRYDYLGFRLSQGPQETSRAEPAGEGVAEGRGKKSGGFRRK